MASLDLVGQCPAEIDHKIAVTMTNLSVREATPTTVKKGAIGVIGVAKGIPDVTGDCTLSWPKTGIEINVGVLKNKPGGFTLTFTGGINRYALLGIRISERSLTVDNGAGNVEWKFNFTGTELVDMS